MTSERTNYNRAPLYELLAIIILELLSALIKEAEYENSQNMFDS